MTTLLAVVAAVTLGLPFQAVVSIVLDAVAGVGEARVVDRHLRFEDKR